MYKNTFRLQQKGLHPLTHAVMESRNRSIVLVSGAFHTEIHIEPCMELFKRAGYRIIPHPLLVVGIKDPRPTFAEEVASISSKIVTEIRNGRDVGLICHSAGGFPACEAINQFLSTATDGERSKLVRLILLASFIDIPRTRQNSLDDGWLSFDVAAGVAHYHNPGETFFNDMPEDQRGPFIEALKPITPWVDAVELSSEEWKTIPKTYIMCLRDKALPVEIQEKEIAENEMEVVKIDAGHDPFISQPEKFVSLVDRILRS